MGNMQLERVEFIVTYQCNSNCKHCLIQPHVHLGETMDPLTAQVFVELLSQNYPLLSISVFGGEPILALETVVSIFQTAKKFGIPHRQLLTNGQWRPKSTIEKDSLQLEQLGNIARRLNEAGMNAVDISLDAFHAECFDINQTFQVAHLLIGLGITQVKMSPRWLYGSSQAERYNHITQELLNRAENEGISVSRGENIQPRGNALENFPDLLPKVTIIGNETCRDVPNMPDLGQIKSLCISPMGDLIICNNFIIGRATSATLLNMLQAYSPKKYPDIYAVYEKGLGGLIELAREKHISLPKGPFYSICDACFQFRKALRITETCNA